VVRRRKWRRHPLLRRRRPIQQPRGDMVVPIAEDRGGYRNGIAHDAFRGIAAAFDLRLNFFDDDAAAALFGFHAASISCNLISWQYTDTLRDVTNRRPIASNLNSAAPVCTYCFTNRHAAQQERDCRTP